MKLVLASQSPRRKELLGRLGLEFTTKASQVDEEAFSAATPEELVKTLSREKARWVAQRESEDAIVIGADTVVVLDGDVLGKPGSQAQAREMLRRLSGRVHQVYTGVSVCQGDFTVTQVEATQVRFRPLTEEEIHCYVRSGEPMDKAGAYGLQGLGALLVEGVEGDYTNVVGLPICRLGHILLQFGIDCLALEAR